ncbi:LpqB family beta-propeller domain-containing protein [Sphaerisporangium corydalis]|uniref:LpqB family beta-propeller domain-containing protein n=1 Tax=Sphaerisporangium corydalis TaxID=1441875 RepID=A0ABV9EB48_9ACTN|nr:LpqB family beta-propeller domain-containing protein [Sphaerisporangium corydalis]
MATSPRGGLRRLGPLAVALALTSAACSTVPTGGNVFAALGERESDPLSQPYVRMLAATPKPKGTPEEIVNGFLSAAASFDDPLRGVARQYLTGEAQRTWSPFDAVTIYDDGKSSSDAPGDVQQAHVELKGAVLGTLDGDGHYVPSQTSGGSVLDKGFTLVKVSGEWRISTAPSGLLLTNDDFKRAYRSFDLYFAAYQSEGLVADQVRVPINPSEGLAKSLVHRLLDGPTTPLRGAVDSAFGPNVDVNDVFVEGDTVVVDFTYGIVDSALVTANREALSAQLYWTLKPLTESRRIEVRVNGDQFPGGPFLIDPRDYDRYDPDLLPHAPKALYLQQGKLHILDKDNGNPVMSGVGAVQARQFSHLAVSNEQPAKVAALEKAGGVWVSGITPGSQWQRWIEGTRLTPPSWDRYGDVWSVSRQGARKAQVLRAHDPTRQMPVSAPGLESTDVTAFRVARDGARVAVISDDGRGQSVLVGSINRTRWAVQNLRTLVPAADGQEITDIAWQDADTLLVLTTAKSDRELTPWSVTQGIRIETPKAATRVEAVTAAPKANDDAPVLAGGPDGEILKWDLQKRTWITLVQNGAGAPVYPLG